MVSDHDGAATTDVGRPHPPLDHVSGATDGASTLLPRRAAQMSHDSAAATAAVAEAVAVASEEAAVEAAEAVAVTAGAVTEAAGRAVDAAVSAREARTIATDAALLADEQDALTAELAAGLVERSPGALPPGAFSPVVLSPGALAPDWAEARDILSAAEERDFQADLRDEAADERESAASLRSFRRVPPYEAAEQYEESLLARRAAALDRLASKADRAAAASDRARLSVARLSPLSQSKNAGGDSRPIDVAAEISHDLRVPLGAMMAILERLEEKLKAHSDPTVANLQRRAVLAGDRMVRMLEAHMTAPAPGDPAPMPEVDLAEIAHRHR